MNAPVAPVAPVVIRCAGAPRDLGLDQGAVLRSRVRRAARGHWARRVFEWARGQHKSLRRDLLRHFPHQAERMMGLARGAGVGSARLAALLAQTPPGANAVAREGGREASGSAAAQAGYHRGAGGSADAERAEAERGARLDCSLPLHCGRGLDDLVLRHSAPDNDRASVEIALAWQAPALVGVNADGLAVCALPGGADEVDSLGGTDGAGAAREGGCAAPALLLAQDCLRLFDRTPNALEWIRSRPAGGCCTLLLADATGRIAGAVVVGERRGELEVQNGCIAVSGAAADGDCATGGSDDAAADGVEADDGAAGGSAMPNSLRVFADPLGRRLGVQTPGGALVWHQVGG